MNHAPHQHRMAVIAICLILTASWAGANGDSVIGFIRRSEDLMEKQMPDDALDAAKCATEADPAYADAWRQLAIVYVAKGKYSEAVTAYQTALVLDPDNTVLHREISTALWNAGDQSKGIEQLQQYVELQNKDASAWRDLARWNYKVGHTDAATQAMRRALKLDPDVASGWRDYGRWAIAANRSDEGIKALCRAAKLEPEHATTWTDLGWCLWSLGRIDKAVKAFSRAIPLEPEDNREAIILQVVAGLAERNKTQEALAFFSRWHPNQTMLSAGERLIQLGRIRAASPFLLNAWSQPSSQRDKAQAGLLMVYAGTVHENPTSIVECLELFVDTQLDTASPEQLDILLECIEIYGSSANLADISQKVAQRIPNRPDFQTRVTDILECAAFERRDSGDNITALVLFRRVLDRDPNRLVWNTAKQLSLSMHSKTETIEWLQGLSERTSDPGISLGVEGCLAEFEGHIRRAAVLYGQSLKHAPEQPEMRLQLFRLHIALGELDKARAIAEWFDKKVKAGLNMYRSYLAEMWTTLRETEKALDLWKALYFFDTPRTFYAVETAKALFELGRASEALIFLEEASLSLPDPQIFELLAEIESALGNPEKAIQWVEQGLAKSPLRRGLLRQYCELAEQLGWVTPEFIKAAYAFLEQDPGHAPVSRILGAVLIASEAEDAQIFQEKLVARNSEFLSSLIALRHLATAEGDFDAAARLSESVVEQRPEDTESLRRYAVSLAENDNFHESLNILRDATKEDRGVVATLIYRRVIAPVYPGRLNISHVRRHIHSLHQSGVQFIFPEECIATNQTAVTLIFVDLDEHVLNLVDAVLEQYDAKAILAVDSKAMSQAVPGKPTPQLLAQFKHEGRWLIASSGPSGLRRETVDASQRFLGNPLTHRLVIDGTVEDAVAHYDRLDVTMASCSKSPLLGSPKILIYPNGDYGQLSLDTRPVYLDLLGSAVSRYFDIAICYDEKGFSDHDRDPLRWPARVISPNLTAEKLVRDIQSKNPYTCMKLDLAKVLYWNRQHEEAIKAFSRAEEAGAISTELNFNLAANAYRQMDYITAHDRIGALTHPALGTSRAEKLDANIRAARRPRADVFARGWIDSDNRDNRQYGINVDISTGHRLNFGLFADYNKWSLSGMGSESGTRLGGHAEIAFRGARKLSARLWNLEPDNLDSIEGGRLILHWPTPLLNGHFNLSASRSEIDTVEAVRLGLYQDIYTVNSYSRLYDNWDLYLAGSHIARRDDNDGWHAEARILRRLKEWPFLGVGYLGRFADNDFDTDVYWTPQELNQHQLHSVWRGGISAVTYGISGQVGYAREQQEDWRLVWGARCRLRYTILMRGELFLDARYLETSRYNLSVISIGGSLRF